MSPVSNVKDVSGLYRGKPPPTLGFAYSAELLGLGLVLDDDIHQTLGQRRVVLIEVVPARQLDRFADGGLVSAAALVDLFGTVDAHHLGRCCGHPDHPSVETFRSAPH